MTPRNPRARRTLVKHDPKEEEYKMLLQEVLDSEGWSVVEKILVRDLMNRRRQIFLMSNKDELFNELKALQMVKNLLNSVYYEADAQMPAHVSQVFT